jgi:hypothetical protein
MAYVPLGTTRFRFVPDNGGEMLLIPAYRIVVLIVFLTVWLAGWTSVGIAAIGELVEAFDPLGAKFLVPWAMVWTYVASILTWMLAGSESVRMRSGNLEIGYSVFGLGRRRLFRAADVKALQVMPRAAIWHKKQAPPMPILGQSKGTIRFRYGAQTQSFGFGLDETEAAEVIAWLRKRLPNG